MVRDILDLNPLNRKSQNQRIKLRVNTHSGAIFRYGDKGGHSEVLKFLKCHIIGGYNSSAAASLNQVPVQQVTKAGCRDACINITLYYDM